MTARTAFDRCEAICSSHGQRCRSPGTYIVGERMACGRHRRWRGPWSERGYCPKAARAEARSRATTPEEHLWCIALAVGPDDGEMWQAGDGTPVDIARHIAAVSEALRRAGQVGSVGMTMASPMR